MSESIQSRILSHLNDPDYRPQKPRRLAGQLNLNDDDQYSSFRQALRQLMDDGRVVLGSRGAVVLPTERIARDEFLGTYRHNRRGFGFIVPQDPTSHEDLYIPEGFNAGAMSGDVVRAKILHRGQRNGKAFHDGKVVEIVQRSQKRFVGSLSRVHGQWVVLPDGNTHTEPILVPDASSRHIKPGTKVVVELTTYPEGADWAEGVITEILGKAGEKDVDLKSAIIQFNLPTDFSDAVRDQARQAVDAFDPETEQHRRIDLSNETIVTIDPDDAKDYDDAISLRRVDHGRWELGVHIADVSHFVRQGTALDEEAKKRGNSTYFPGFVIPMLPEILSNGVCSLQEAVPRLCKSVFITYDESARPVATRFANTIIRSAKRLRYREAQAIIDRAEIIPHPQGDRALADYEKRVVDLVHQMDHLAKRLQKRRREQGQIVLELPEVELVLDDEGKVIDAVPEDQSFTHTLIEMFMVEANEAVARLFDAIDIPFIRRTHPEPDLHDSQRLRQFIEGAGHTLPKNLDRKAIQALLAKVKGRPESFVINLSILKSLTRAEYSPRAIGHFALASEYYTHFTSPIRRYADLTIHRLLDAYLDGKPEIAGYKKDRIDLDEIPSHVDLVEMGKHLSITERRSEDAERDLRQVRILQLMAKHLGEEFEGVVTGITNFGLFVQIRKYLNEGLVRYEDLLDDWWDVDVKSGSVRGQHSGIRIRMGDVVTVRIARVDSARRELDLGIVRLQRSKQSTDQPAPAPRKSKHRKGQSIKKPRRHR